MSMAARQCAADAVRGMLVADAASMGSHWVYKAGDLEDLLSAHWETPEFHEPPSCPFYGPEEYPGMYESGQQSPYGDEAFTLLEFMASQEGGAFAGGEAYARSLFEWAKSYKGRKNHATKLFEENMNRLLSEEAKEVYPECGSDDAQANVFFKVPQIAVKYAAEDQAKYLDCVEQAVRAHQNRDDAVEYALAFARILRSVLEGALPPEAVEAERGAASDLIKSCIDKAQGSAIASAGDDSYDGLQEFFSGYSAELMTPDLPEMYQGILSKTCQFPQSFVVGLKIVLDAYTVRQAAGSEDFDIFAYAIRRNIQAGGDTCGRAPIIACLLAAAGSAPPAAWAEQTARLADVDRALAVLLQ